MLLLFSLEGENSSTPKPHLEQLSFIREKQRLQMRVLLLRCSISFVTANDGRVVLFFSKLKLSLLFMTSGGESKEEVYRFNCLVYIVLKHRYFICPNWERNFVPMKLWFRKFGLCMFETLQKKTLLKDMFAYSQTKKKVHRKIEEELPSSLLSNNWKQFNSVGCLMWRRPLIVLWCLSNKSFGKTN